MVLRTCPVALRAHTLSVHDFSLTAADSRYTKTHLGVPIREMVVLAPWKPPRAELTVGT